VIQWREQPAELPLHSIDSLYSRLPLAEAKLVEARQSDGLVIVVDAAARIEVEQHLGARHDEQGGLLVGDVFTGATGAILAVFVRTGVPATEFSSSGVSLRMETGVWTRAREALREKELIIGWYHSHPGLGAFFSHTDRRTQRAFFPHPFSIGWVRDSIYAQECWFAGAESDAVPAERTITLNPGRAA